eukprot:CAMPEP_0178773952 /NCGR_PEP_ID=MMETSP0744-20121128/23377_1 /TAXON_ID=913974 /ORGANISM="Nitzschia punctata, Strain CCMP561" /LENGTH=149 /DNA_ID=CAMNT_0020430785 /DNA_START=34 /DNA_END=484 /DNA_ORIENTATION=-
MDWKPVFFKQRKKVEGNRHIAYLATSIPLAIVSFAICYVLVDNGVDVGALLAKVGIESTGAADKAGTLAIAYAAHKAASPIRFPPTVILTPVVAKMIGGNQQLARKNDEAQVRRRLNIFYIMAQEAMVVLAVERRRFQEQWSFDKIIQF